MAYQYPGYQDNPQQTPQQQYHHPQGPHYSAHPGHAQYPSGPPHNDSPGQPQSQPPHPTYGNGYPYQNSSAGSGYSSAPFQQTSSYNPQAYAQNPAQYTTQNYPSTMPEQSAGYSQYNPALYSSQYGYAQPAAQDYSRYQQASYTAPGHPTAATYGSPNRPTQRSSQSYQHETQSPVPPPVPPRPTSSTRSSMSVYSTYSQPAPQMASSSYAPIAQQTPYPGYGSNATAMAGYASHPDFDAAANVKTDDLNLPTIPAPPAYSPMGDLFPRRESEASRRTGSAASTQLYSTQSPDIPPPPPAHGPQHTDSSARHPQSRPLPGPPEPDIGPDYYRPTARIDAEDLDYSAERQDELFDEVETAILNASSPAAFASSPAIRQGDKSASNSPRPMFGSHRRKENTLNGYSPTSSGKGGDSDVEALAGLEAMRMADEEEERRRRSGTGGLLGRLGHSDDSDNENYNNIDMGLYGGGYGGHVSYGGTTATGVGDYHNQLPSPSGLTNVRPSRHEREFSYESNNEFISPTRSFSAARVDSSGTGGLVDPNDGPPSASVDDGDSYSFTDDTVETSGPPDLFFMPDTSPLYRPLPPPPPSSSAESAPGIDTPSTSSASASIHPLTPSGSIRGLVHTQSDVAVPRFSSLKEFGSSPSVSHPTRSKTDAEERLRKTGLHTSLEYRNSTHITLPATPADNTVTIDLPSLPSKRFNAAKLGATEFRRCEQPWALSSIYQWLRYVANPEQVTELKEVMIREALVALFTNKVPTMNITDAEVLVQRVVADMYDAGVLRPTEEWVRLVPGTLTGVIVQLTQGGCYAPSLHEHTTPGRCYSPHCQRTLKKVNLQATPARSGEDWATFYKLKKEDLEGHDKKEIERQNILHEIVQTEDQYMGQIDVLQHVYRDSLAAAQPAVIDPKRFNVFVRDVFGKIDAVRRANEDHLLAQLKYRQDEQGPWIVGFSDIFRQWIRKARHAYVEYAAGFPAASLIVRQELERNVEFKSFLDKARANKASNRLGLDTYLKAPITRLQRYSLLLVTVHKNMKEESEEKTHLQVAIDEVKEVTKECDARVAEMQRKVDLTDLNQKLILRPGMSQEVELNLNHLGRCLIHQGSLQRIGSKKFNMVDTHALLLDHYFILAKAIYLIQRGTGAKIEKYDVSRLPIPMDLLVLESFDDDPVRQSHYARGLTTVATMQTRAPGSDVARNRTATVSTPANPLDRVNTAASLSSVTSTASAPAVTTLTDTSKEAENILYPFKIKHLGRESYTLFASSANQRAEWRTKLIEAKSKHAKSLHRQNAEPFLLNIIADSAFFYDSSTGVSGSKPVVIEDTPMDRAIKEVEQRFKESGRPSPICRARINCATSFVTPHPGKHMTAIGTDFGVYIAETGNPRGWVRAITMTKVTQIAVLEEFNVFLLISSGALIAYHLDIVINPEISNGTNDAGSRRAPQKLSGTRDVGFFAVGKMKDRTLVLYKKRDGLSSTFKVLEPVFQKSTEKKRSIFKRSNTEFFRDFDEFYIPAECGGMNLFTNALSVSTSRGFEVLTLDKKQTFSVPDLRAPEVGNIAHHIEGQTTLGMLKLSDQEFILCYEKCAVYVNKHGDVSRSVIMNFVGKARSAALYGPYLVLFDTDFVEVRNAQNGRLKQIVSGRDVRCLDDGGGGSLSGGSIPPAGGTNGASNGGLGTGGRTVKLAMAHPSNERCQIVVELALNRDLKE